MSRTIVVSDLHGSTATLMRALEHARFEDRDHLIIAGDLVDVGDDDTIAAAREVGATILAGNHEVAAALGLRIAPQHASSLDRGREFLEYFANGEWPLAAHADGWLITHAGVSATLSDILATAGPEPDAIAAELNRIFRAEATDALDRVPLVAGDLDRYRLMGGEYGPLWFRPSRMELVPQGLRQVVGHTPPEMLPSAQLMGLSARGWRLIEPGGHAGERPVTRYAVIETGEATVVEV